MDKEEPTNAEEEEQESSLRDDLESAIEEETDEEGKQTEDAPAKEEGGEEGSGEPTPEGEDGKPTDGKIGDAEGEATPEGINAPMGFSPEAREQWKDVPDVVKQQIQARETQIDEAIANTGEYRRTHTAMTELAQSYAPILAAEGAETPMAAVEGLFRTVAELRVGTPQQTAQRMADLIGHYGIDISMLDSALSGQPIVSPEQTAMSQMMDDKLAPFQDMMANQQNNAAVSQKANADAVNTELQEFAKGAEFLNDVRADMADFIEMASKRGEVMTFQQAYEKACSMNASVSKVLADRALVAGKAKANGKAAAGSALPASGAAIANGGSGDDSLRGTINSIWDSYSE